MAPTRFTSSLFLALFCFAFFALHPRLTLFQANVAQAAKAADMIDPMRHEIQIITAKTFDNIIGKFRNDGAAALLHFSSKKPADGKFINGVYNNVAKELKGMAKIGAIDCAEWPVFCKENSNPSLDTPTIIVYPPNPMPSSVYSGATTQEAIISQIYRMLPSGRVTQLSTANIDSFLTEALSMPKVVLFSSKQKSPVIFNALSNAFKNRVSFGFVPSNDQDAAALMKRFKVKKTPGCFIISGAGGKPEVYSGKMNFGSLHDWVNIRSETFVKGGGFSDSSDSSTSAEGPKPWRVQKVPEVTGPSHQDVCFKGASLCVIYLSHGSPSTEEMQMLEALSEDYPDESSRGARFRWMWIDLSVETNFKQMLKLTDGVKLPNAVVFNPHRRLRFMLHPSDQVATKKSIAALLERITSGDARFTNVAEKKLPSFAVRDSGNSATKKDEL